MRRAPLRPLLSLWALSLSALVTLGLAALGPPALRAGDPPSPRHGSAATADKRVVLLELYTSQG